MNNDSTDLTPKSTRPHPTRPGRTLVRHDNAADYQVCGDCGLVIGDGIWTPYDAQYFAGNPDVCPRCEGDMGWMFQEDDEEDA